MWLTGIKLTSNSRTRPRRFFLLPLALALLALAAACSSGGSTESTATPAGSGQVPVENPDGTGRPDSPVLTGDARRGLDSYVVNGCSTCHSSNNPDLGPTHAGIFETAATRVEGLSAEEYIEQSIRNPDAFIVPGFASPSTMPEFSELTDEEIRLLIAYMKTLTTGTNSPLVSVDSLPPGMSENGRILYGSIGCSGCHSLSTDRIVGPGFKAIEARASAMRPGLTADEYIVESIVEPEVFIVPGFPRQMPAFDEISAQELADLLAFLKSID